MNYYDYYDCEVMADKIQELEENGSNLGKLIEKRGNHEVCHHPLLIGKSVIGNLQNWKFRYF